MDSSSLIFSFRPVIIFIIEITLCILILKTNSRIKTPSFFLVLFLSLYQLGEALIIFTDFKYSSLFAFIATSLLPIIGLILLEKINFNKIRFTPILFIIPSIYIIKVILNPVIFSDLSTEYCFVKYANLIAYNKVYYNWSNLYYLPFLCISLIVGILGFFIQKNTEKKKLNILMSLSYFILLIAPTLAWIILKHSHLYITSTMCTVGISTAIIVYIMTLKSNSSISKDL